MNGNRFFLDTNAVISLLKNNAPLSEKLFNAEWIGISIITYIELLCFKWLTKEENLLINQFTERVHVIDLEFGNSEMIKLIISLRREYSIKLPDCIIAASSIVFNCSLITGDTIFKKIKDLKLISL